jgi:hypothetical protein
MNVVFEVNRHSPTHLDALPVRPHNNTDRTQLIDAMSRSAASDVRLATVCRTYDNNSNGESLVMRLH